MGQKRSGVGFFSLEIYVQFFIGFILISAAGISLGYTNPGDVLAINKLYTSLGSPALPGWVASAGDPCGEAWQGVQCNNSYIESITLNAANLRGQLGEALGTFAQIKTIDLSNNQIGGSIPTSLPITMQTFFLSANQLTGSIPSSLASLTHLTDMSVNDNLLTGELPDAFQTLTGLINLDLSSNNLSGQLPPSMESLLSLTTLHVQNNQLSGTLDVLQNLPLQDLNVENNLFSGTIPEKLLSIPNFKQDGNLFNSSTSPLPSPASPTASPGTRPPSRPFFPPPSSESPPTTKPANGPSALEQSKSSSKKSSKVKRIVWISIAAVFMFIVLVLAILLCMPWCLKKRRESGRISKQQIGAHNVREEDTRDSMSSLLPISQVGKGPKAEVVVSKEDNLRESRRIAAIPKPQNDFDPYVQRVTAIPKPQNMHDRYVQRMDSMTSQDDLEMDFSGIDMNFLPPPPPPPPPQTPPPPSPPPPPPPPPPTKKVIAEPIVPAVTLNKPAKASNVQTSARSFNIASLQLYTDSFSQENLIGVGMLGSVYKAQLPDGKLLAVKKLDKRTSSRQKDEDFLELVDGIDKLRHANIVELKGYCSEHGQKLLIYEYCSNGSLHDAMHSDDEFRKIFSWNTRVRMALGAARALEYLHEVCQPPVVHRNFKSANVLLDDEFAVCVSDCGLAPLISSGSVSQLSGHLQSAYGYGAPEFESGIYTYQSDVYSFGVVMLELLTGRKPYDRMRTRGEQSLVRWAIPQLHDIDALSRMVDPSLKGEYPAKSLSHFADIISRCVQPEPEFRPPMSEVVQDLLDIIRREPNQYRSGSE